MNQWLKFTRFMLYPLTIPAISTLNFIRNNIWFILAPTGIEPVLLKWRLSELTNYSMTPFIYYLLYAKKGLEPLNFSSWDWYVTIYTTSQFITFNLISNFMPWHKISIQAERLELSRLLTSSLKEDMATITSYLLIIID